MTELDLLHDFNKLNIEKSNLKANHSNIEVISTVDIQIESIISKLRTVENKEYSRKAWLHICEQLKLYIDQLNVAIPQFIDRDQCTSIKDLFFLNIIRNIHVSVEGQAYGLSKPVNLKFYNIENYNSVNKNTVINFLTEELGPLYQKQMDFPELFNFLAQFKEKLFIQFNIPYNTL